MAQTTGTTTITRKPQDGKSPVAYEIVPERTVYTSEETNELPFKVYKIVGEERTLLHEEIEGGTYVLESVLAGDVFYDEKTDMYVLSDSSAFGYGDNCTVVLHLSSDDVVLATFTWGFTQRGKQGATFSIRKWEDVKVGDNFRVESAEDGVLISDIVIYTDANGVTSKWICKKAFTVTSSGTTTKDNTTPKLGSEYWTAFNNFYNVATDLVLADKAIIDNLLLNNMKAYPKDADGNWDTENPTVEIDGNTGVMKAKDLQITPSDATMAGGRYIKIDYGIGKSPTFRLVYDNISISISPAGGIEYIRRFRDGTIHQATIDNNGVSVLNKKGEAVLQGTFDGTVRILGKMVGWGDDGVLRAK